MAKPSPVGFKELLQLTALGIPADTIKFKNVTLESEKYVCVREEGANSVAIIDTASKNVLRLPVAVDSAIMNPVSKVVALRAGNNLQIYNLEMKSKMKSVTIDDPVVFWRWLSPKQVAVVTDKSVYHWSMDGTEQPKKVFDRAAYEGQVQILNYEESTDGQWLILSGIAAAAGGIKGVLQVYSVAMKASQPTMDSHAACFANIKLDGQDTESTLFCFTQTVGSESKLNIIQLGVPKTEAFKQSSPLKFQQPNDLPVSLSADHKHGVVYVVSKAGLLLMYEIFSGKCIFAQQASRVTMFTSCEHSETGGIVTVDQSGRVGHFFVDEKTIVPFICNTLNDMELGVKFAKRWNLSGADNIFVEQFRRLMEAQRYDQAMQLAAESPQGILRSIDTVNQLKAIPQPAGQTAYVLQYFQLLLKKGALNQIESIELARPVLAKRSEAGMNHIKDWLKDNKLECSEDLGDLLKNHNIQLALSVYLRAKVPEKVIGCFLALGAQEATDAKAQEYFSNIFAYAKRVNFEPDYSVLISQLIRVNPDRAKDFALHLLNNSDGVTVDVTTLIHAFMQQNDIKNTTNVLLEYLKPRGDREEDGHLQTKLLEINLLNMPQVADAIMESEDYKFSHYDKAKIAALCERAQLYQRALQHYSDLDDIKRVLTNTHMLNPEFLLEYFGQMTPENCLECLRDQLKYNLQQNIRLVVEVAKKWSDHLTPPKLIELFEDFKSFNGIYFYLGSFVNFTEDKSAVFKYIEAALKLNQLKEVERVCRDNEHYDPVEVKELLLQANLKDPRPLIHVCDRFDFVAELTQHLFSNNMYMFIEAYVQRMNAKATPQVVGTLIELNASEEQIKKLLSQVRVPVDDPNFFENLVNEVEKRNSLKVLRPFLEARKDEGMEDKHLHNGLAKIYIDINYNPQAFLTTNTFYDSAEVGKYCESRDPHLSFIAFKRAGGSCDDQLISITNKNGFFKDQARYLVERQDLELWTKVLTEENEHRRALIDQVVATALPESRVPEEVSTTVKAFMAANLPSELIELLERIILHGPSDGEFRTNRNLQNLLILTAIKADKKRVMDYVNRMENYDGPDIAKIAASDQYELFEEAFFIYKKFKKGEDAINVLLQNLKSIERAVEYAKYLNEKDVWGVLANAQLAAGLVKDAIESFLKADEAASFAAVIKAAKAEGCIDELVSFLKMARGKMKDSSLDNEMIYCYAKTNKLSDIEEFIGQPNTAKIADVGDQCFCEGLYEAARILYNHIGNNAKLALAYVKMEMWQEAVEAARKANSMPTWKAVCFACVDAKNFRQAQMCGINIIVFMDHLNDLVRHYEINGLFSELIAVLEQGINLDRAHQGIYTSLGVMYAKHKEEKLMEHLKLYWSRLNIPTLLQACKDNLHWAETVFLFAHYDQFDNAIDVMIEHAAECWSHELFKENIKQVSNTEIFYRAISYYIEAHPAQLTDLLIDLTAKLDHSRVVSIVRSANHIPLIEKYLLNVQRENIQPVNEALNAMYVKEENYKALKESISQYDAFDQIQLAQSLESHELLEFRRIASSLFKMNKRFDRAIELSKQDNLWGDAMETTAASGDAQLAEELLDYFVQKGEQDSFTACLYACYELIKPDMVLELAWRKNLLTAAMPYFIQRFRQYEDQMAYVMKRFKDQDDEKAALVKAQKAAEQDQSATDAAFVGRNAGPYNPMMAPLALAAPPGAYGIQPMMTPQYNPNQMGQMGGQMGAPGYY